MSSVLIIDDEPDIVLLARTILELAGHQASSADSMRSGLAAIEERRPDLVLLDVNLPDGDAWEALRRIRAGRHAALPVIVVSAHRGEAIHAQADRHGATVLGKPFSHQGLVEAVSSVLPG